MGSSTDAYCIHLAHRTDRKLHMDDIALRYPSLRIHYVDGVYNSDGATGCTLSHKKVIREAKARGDPYVLVLEDDCDFLVSDSELIAFLHTIKEYIHTHPDVEIVNGCGNLEDFTISSTTLLNDMYFLKSNPVYTTHCIVYCASVYDKFLATRSDLPPDVITNDFNMVFTYPYLATQLPSYSDISNKDISYSNIKESQDLVKTFIDRCVKSYLYNIDTTYTRMKLGTIVTSTDTNPLYMDFIPSFIKSWSLLVPEADIVIVLVAISIPEQLKEYSKHIVLFPPIVGIHTAFQAQCIRLLYPRQVTRDEGVLITDMDMLPMNRRYYVNSIETIPDDHFIVYRDVCLPEEISMCYNIASPSTWTSMFGTKSVQNLLQEWHAETGYDGIHGGKGWGTDQHILVTMFNAWNGPKTVLNDTVTQFSRLDRGWPLQFQDKQGLRNKIQSGTYADYHCLRPYQQHKEINDFIVQCLESMRVFSFCLYGPERPIYYRGLIENVEIIQQHFPGWTVFVYYAPDVTTQMIEKLKTYSNVILRPTGVTGPVNMIYRSFAIDEPYVEVMMVRDADSRVHWRDRWAINDFMNRPEYTAHTIRDNYVHTVALMGGLWGMRKIDGINIQAEYAKFSKETMNQRGHDQYFLQGVIYSKVLPNLLVHYSNHRLSLGENGVEFPFAWSEECYCGKVELEHLEPSRFVKFSNEVQTLPTSFVIPKPSGNSNPLNFLFKR